jgi:hypothetical protein
MRGVLPAVFGVLVAASTASGQDTAARIAPAAAASPVAGPPQRLNLGPYRSVHADDPAALADQLRYREQVEVRGKAMDARSLTLKLEWWMRDIELDRGATPASMSAPSIAEMRDYRPHPADSINLMPVMEWVAEKLGRKKK